MQPTKYKYKPYPSVSLPERKWPGNSMTQAPTWCSTDLRDGNQALSEPMDPQEKLEFFKELVAMGFKEIEIGYPSASEADFQTARLLIESGAIPDDVAIQVLAPARDELIARTFEAVEGAKNVIMHLYMNTSPFFRDVVYRVDKQTLINMVCHGAHTMTALAEKRADGGSGIRYEFSPESFTDTEPEYAIEVCSRVLEAFGATEEKKLILNLPCTVERCMPNQFADRIEHFCRNLPGRDRAIVSVHTHNDRGTGVAATEMAMLAGAQRVEGTLFGNGERTGNVDIVTLAMNLFTHG
ncbi:MAG: 2-isopropylmalate synthase, partial [Clostridia bacterium]|nr:2-isopropylmalate synthase [Clostridia bacterium]